MFPVLEAQTHVNNFHFHIKFAVFFVFIRFYINDEMGKALGRRIYSWPNIYIFSFGDVLIKKQQ